MKIKTFTLFFTTIVFLICAHSINGQVTHVVEVMPSFFIPGGLVIDVGDTVEWINTSGIHNVNGNTETFSDNPESFGNELGSDWTYSYVFNTPGEYDYQCDAHISMGMVGSVVVGDVTTSIPARDGELVSSVYPNPASDVVVVELNSLGFHSNNLELLLIDQLGRTIQSKRIVSSNRFEIEVSHLNSGLYFFQLIDEEQTLHTGRVVVR